MKNILLIIQARLGSSRFKKKVIRKITDLPSIVYQYKRIKEVKNDIKLVVAIPKKESERELKEILKNNEITFFEGDENNVFQRFLNCSRKFNSDILIRINGDCPLISPSTIDRVINKFFISPNIDYISTTLNESYPLGEHVELFTSQAIEKASNLQRTEEDNEHVTPIFYRNQDVFKCTSLEKTFNYPSKLRLCIDYPEDLEFINEIANFFYPDKNFDLKEILSFISKNKELMNKNTQFKKSRII